MPQYHRTSYDTIAIVPLYVVIRSCHHTYRHDIILALSLITASAAMLLSVASTEPSKDAEAASRTLYVSNVPLNYNFQDLSSLFSCFGPVESVSIGGMYCVVRARASTQCARHVTSWRRQRDAHAMADHLFVFFYFFCYSFFGNCVRCGYGNGCRCPSARRRGSGQPKRASGV